MAKYSPSITEIFQALADPTRLAIICALAGGAQTVSALAAPFDMALPSFMKHVTALERTGLIRSHKLGRSRTCELVPATLHQAEQWMVEQRAIWEARSDRMVAFVEDLHHQEHVHDSKPARRR